MSQLQVSPTALRAALPVITIVTAVVAGVTVGVEISLLVVAAGAFAGVIALVWASVQSLTGELPLTLDEALTLGAPSAEEEQKRSVLRALKDLEFERGVGKIGEEDYAELSARYRAEAKRLMQVLDHEQEPERERVERLLRERLAKAPASASAGAAPVDTAPEPSTEVTASETPDAGAEVPAPVAAKTPVPAREEGEAP
jgi:hypothetical protein